MKEAPVLGKQVKKSEQDFQRYELVEEPRTEEEKEASKKAYTVRPTAYAIPHAPALQSTPVPRTFVPTGWGGGQERQ